MEAYIEPGNDYVVEAWTKALIKQNIKVHSGPQLPATSPPLSFLYQDYDNYDFETRDKKAQFVYSYIYRKALTRKNYLGNTILHYRVKRPNSILHTAWPDSFNFELDFPEFLDDALDECWDLKQELSNESKTWILKPALGERAHGIRIFKTQDDLQDIFDETMADADAASDDEEQDAAEMRHFVVQEYVTNPKLINKRKFHLRVYVLCIGKLKVYVNQRMLALFSGTNYNAQDLTSLRGHLTNTCFQGEEATVSLLEDILPNHDAKSIVDQICSCVRDLFEAAEGDPINFQSLENAIEFYGLDFLVTDDLKIKLLEVNAYPDFKQTGEKLRHVVDNLFAETADLLFNEGKNVKDLREVLNREH